MSPSPQALEALSRAARRHGAQAVVDVTPRPGLTNACDFCGHDLGRRAYTRFGCEAFTRTVYAAGVPTVLVLDGYWAACRRCAPLVAARDWRGLVDRVLAVARAEGRRLLPGHRSELAGLYGQLAGHLTGHDVTGRWQP